MINEFFARFIHKTSPKPNGSGTNDGKTPILNTLELHGVKTPRLVEFIREYGTLIEWMVQCEAIEKQRQAKWALLTKEQAVHEVSCCLEDLFRKIIAEDNQRISITKK